MWKFVAVVPGRLKVRILRMCKGALKYARKMKPERII